MEDPGNGRVTLAVIQRDIQHLSQLLEDHIDICTAGANDREHRLRIMEDHVGRLEERQGVIAAAQVSFTTIASLIAGWFGART